MLYLLLRYVFIAYFAHFLLNLALLIESTVYNHLLFFFRIFPALDVLKSSVLCILYLAFIHRTQRAVKLVLFSYSDYKRKVVRRLYGFADRLIYILAIY